MLRPLDTTDEQMLVERWLAGDPDARSELVARYEPAISHTCRQRLGRDMRNPDQLDDLVQHVWLALLDQDGKRLRRFDPSRGNLKTFLQVIAGQEVVNWLRVRRAKRVGFPADGAEPGYRCAFLSEQLLIGELLDSLSPAQRRQFQRDQESITDEPCPDSVRKMRMRIEQKARHHLDLR